MPNPGHDPQIAFADVVVPGPAIDLTAWECWTAHDGSVVHHYARGPCPTCHATAQGHIDDAPHPIEPLGPDREPPVAAPPPTVEIPVRCTCGHDHGRDNATGCGRRWSILCPRDQP